MQVTQRQYILAWITSFFIIILRKYLKAVWALKHIRLNKDIFLLKNVSKIA